MQNPVLVSERLSFHPWDAEDFPLLVTLHREPEVQHFLQMGDPPWGEAFLRAKFEGFRAEYALHGWTKFKVLDARGTFLERAGFGGFDETGELELGYSFMRPFWDHGYATQAATALLGWI